MIAAARLRRILIALSGGAALFALMGNGIALGKQSNEARELKGPRANYPLIASWFNLEGYCEVQFSVDEVGFPFAVTPSCTRRIFCSEAKRAVTDAKFAPKRVNGMAQIRTNVVYPMVFFIDGSGYNKDEDPRQLELCEPKAVA